jgi:hypothetical protein
MANHRALQGLCRLGALLLAPLLLVVMSASAHDIPIDALAQIYVKPDGQHLNVLIRVPLKAMRDVEFPETPERFLDLDHIDKFLREASTLWLSEPLEIYEDGALLPKPSVLQTRVSLESDRSFATYQEATARLTGPSLTNDTKI